jgi:hypothetical protein
MFGFFLRFFITSLKLIGKIFFILAGAVFSGIVNAFFSMIDSDDGTAGETEPEHQKPIIVDRNSAMQAFVSGQCGEAEAAQYWNFEDKR